MSSVSQIQFNIVPYAFLIAIFKTVLSQFYLFINTTIFYFVAPLEPENLRTSHVLASEHSYYEIIVEWDVPAILPDAYNVSLYFENFPEVWKSLSGVCSVHHLIESNDSNLLLVSDVSLILFSDKFKTEVNASFERVHTRDPTYDVYVTAISKGGTVMASIRNANLTSYTEMLGK